jgi:hypothetical protein
MTVMNDVYVSSITFFAAGAFALAVFGAGAERALGAPRGAAFGFSAATAGAAAAFFFGAAFLADFLAAAGFLAAVFLTVAFFATGFLVADLAFGLAAAAFFTGVFMVPAADVIVDRNDQKQGS